ncbi:GGDEF domain-containing protein [Vibrio sinaloensis]|uniref:GGDEF domain-containing protein n=1 Tax=Photobacterium sp. (strain ATCC 43367) TaxID=379097 RepID=UPI000AB9C2E9|nr:GGDEF domain-containing protein [Vibrio sinaloensis]
MREHSMPVPDELESRRSVLYVVLIVTIVATIGFSLLNSMLWPSYALIQAAVVLLWLGILRVVRKTPKLQLWSLCYLISSFCLVFYPFLIIDFRVGLFSWIFIFPILSYLLLGRKLGMAATFVGSLSGLGALTWRIWQQDPNIHWVALTNYATCMLAIWAMAHVYEYKRESVVRRLHNMATKDPLTGLLNVRTLLDTLDCAIEQAKQRSQPLTVIYIDVNDFKIINDTQGHQRGNEILVTLAKEMKYATRQYDHLFRSGGDEFVMIFPNCTKKQAQMICEHRLASELCKRERKITLSIGYAQTGTTSYLTPDELLQQADNNMYEVKHAYKQRLMLNDASFQG